MKRISNVRLALAVLGVLWIPAIMSTGLVLVWRSWFPNHGGNGIIYALAFFIASAATASFVLFWIRRREP